MVRSDPSLTVYDWGGNYTVADYQESDGSPYDLVSIDGSNLAAYDARERSERMPVEGPITRLGEGDDTFVVSNIGYFVSQDSMAYETPLMIALRVSAGPFAIRCAHRLLHPVSSAAFTAGAWAVRSRCFATCARPRGAPGP